MITSLIITRSWNDAEKASGVYITKDSGMREEASVGIATWLKFKNEYLGW